MAEARRKAFVCGHPIAHSRSPKIHGHWLQAYGIDGSYEAMDVAPQEFPAFLEGMAQAGFAGGNITIPHKEAAYRLAARRDEAAETIGAVNTLWLEDGIVWGGNTDAYGFAANLNEYAPGWQQGSIAVVLGAGGASRAIIHALKKGGIGDIRIVNRNLSRAVELADHFGGGVSAHPLPAAGELLGDCGLLVNTTSIGMKGSAEASPVDLSLMPDEAVITDIVYVPLETPLLAAARARGLKAVNGLGMLLHQAAPGFERWFGLRPQVTSELRDMIVADLGASA